MRIHDFRLLNSVETAALTEACWIVVRWQHLRCLQHSENILSSSYTLSFALWVAMVPGHYALWGPIGAPRR